MMPLKKAWCAAHWKADRLNADQLSKKETGCKVKAWANGCMENIKNC
jgi:hypothetical protein